MKDPAPLIQEFIQRKKQVLNLEMRQFVLLFALEALFILFYVFGQEQLGANKHLPVLALSAFLVLFFELVAINGKMGLVSQYLKQFESYLASLGYEGVIWESKAIDQIIFVPGNVFTLPAGLTIALLLVQVFYAVYVAFTEELTLMIVVALIILLVVGYTLFAGRGRNVAQVFPHAPGDSRS